MGRGLTRGWNKRLDQPDLYELAIQRAKNPHKEGFSSGAGMVALEIIEQSRRTALKPITPRYSIGQAIKFSGAIHYRARGHHIQYGVIRNWYPKNGIAYYEVETAKGRKQLAQWQCHVIPIAGYLPAPKVEVLQIVTKEQAA